MTRTRLVPSTLALALGLASGCREPPARRLELVPAPPAVEVAPIVQQELARAQHEGRDLLVYVGAGWCEPCRRFDEAAARGALDRDFPMLRLMEFDLDRDGARLQAAGYTSQLIPLFARPEPSGRSSPVRIEGSVKGNEAVANLTPRLRELLR
jgi:hypothetical protein